MAKVRVNSQYIYDPCMWDILDPKTNLKRGDIVRVINPGRGCPPANTMGCCHVENLAGEFLGLVSTSSLVKDTPLNRWAYLSDESMQDIARQMAEKKTITQMRKIQESYATVPPGADELTAKGINNYWAVVTSAIDYRAFVMNMED